MRRRGHSTLALPLPPDLACQEMRRERRGGDREKREIGELTCGPKGIFDISHDFSLLFDRKLLF
jgi:hypothetical protein